MTDDDGCAFAVRAALGGLVEVGSELIAAGIERHILGRGHCRDYEGLDWLLMDVEKLATPCHRI